MDIRKTLLELRGLWESDYKASFIEARRLRFDPRYGDLILLVMPALSIVSDPQVIERECRFAKEQIEKIRSGQHQSNTVALEDLFLHKIFFPLSIEELLGIELADARELVRQGYIFEAKQIVYQLRQELGNRPKSLLFADLKSILKTIQVIPQDIGVTDTEYANWIQMFH